MSEQSRPGSGGAATAVVVLVVAACLLSSARIAVDATRLLKAGPDDITRRSDERFATLKTVLPSRGVVGYLGESGNTGTENYYLTQYALVPLVVEKTTERSLVIGNFPRERPKTLPEGLEVVQDFGSGVLLLHNRNISADAR